MKATGIIRRIDDLGRINIPKDIREKYNIRDGEAMEFFLQEDCICLKKYDNTDEIEQKCAKWVNNHKNNILSINFIDGQISCLFIKNGEVKKATVKFNLCDNFNLNVAIYYCAKKVGLEVEGI